MGRNAATASLTRLLFHAFPLLGLLMLAGCGQKDPAQNGTAGTAAQTSAGASVYAGTDRSRLCLKEGRAGLIVYAQGRDANCSIRGTVQRSGGRLTIIPDGDTACRLEARAEGNALTFGAVSPACSYYCGPGASYAGTKFSPAPATLPVTDLAGDPLC